MATLVLGAVGSAIGGAFGGAILGFSGAAIGGFIGSTIGSVVDNWIVSSLAPAQRIEGARRMMPEIALGDIGPGALILFRMAPRAIAKHVGILTTPDSFIHSYERLGVIEEVLTPIWRRRIAFAFLFPES